MALNTNLLAQTPDLAGSFVQGRQEARQNKLAEMQMMQQQQQFAQQQQDYAQTNAMNKYLQGANLNTPEGMAGLNQFGLKGITTGTTLAKNKADIAAAQSKQQLDKLSIMEKAADQAGSIYSAVQQNPAAWPQARQQIAGMMAQFGGDPNSIPLQYDPNFIATEMKKGMKVKDALTDQRARETQQITMRGQNITANIGNERNRIAAGQLGVAQQRFDAESATGTLTPQTKDFLAQTYIQTGSLPPMGMGKSASKMRQEVLDRAAEMAMGGGTTAADAAGNVKSAKQDVASQTAALKDFSSGVSAKKTTAVSTALNHLDTADKLADALNNGNVRAFNMIANQLGTQVGATAPGNLETAAGIIGAEVIKAIVANGGSAKEREEARNTFKNSKTPEQLKSNANVYRELLGGQLTTLAQQYETGTNRKDFNKKLSPAAIKLLGASTPVSAPAAKGGGVDTSNPLLR